MTYTPKRMGVNIQPPKFVNPTLLTHPNIPKPLHGVNPRSILGRAWWDKVRQKAYKKNNYCCWACGIHKSQAKYHSWLEAHEHYEINYRTGKVILIKIVALCHSCHNFIHNGRLERLWSDEKISKEKYCDIMNHGYDILNAAKLAKSSSYVLIGAEWKDYHLVLRGKKYYSPHKDIDVWWAHYND